MIEKNQQLLQELEKEGVKFLPWIGDEYEKGIYYDENGKLQCGTDKDKGKKVLVLGESFYWNDEDDGNGKMFIHDLIKDLVNPESEFQPYMRTFTKFERAMTGKPWEEEKKKEKRSDFWEHIMFYDYVQEPLKYPRLSPTDKQFKKSVNAFWKILDVYKPDWIIAWGMRLYNHLPQEGEQGEDIEFGEESVETWIYKENIRVVPIYHPAAPSFSNQIWYNIFRQIL